MALVLFPKFAFLFGPCSDTVLGEWLCRLLGSFGPSWQASFVWELSYFALEIRSPEPKGLVLQPGEFCRCVVG